MTAWDVIAILSALWLGYHMPEFFRYHAFADMMAKRRPKPHTFG